MSSNWPNLAVSSTETTLLKDSDKLHSVIRGLNALAVNGLVPMFYSDKQVFCYTLKKTQSGMVQEGVSPRYTAITLMGLHRLEQHGGTSPIDIPQTFDALLGDTSWITNIGDLGLLHWLCALIAPHRLEEFNQKLDVKTALTRFPDAAQRHTMYLSWFLTGLSHQALARPDLAQGTKDMAAEVCRIIQRNQGKQGVFAHGAGKGMSGMLRGYMGSFADQVYPIYAFSRFVQAYGDETAAKKALDCALNICEAQGPLGQWWWHYDAASGKVAETYPVFSVHQHAMGPMALMALGEALQSDFSPWIFKGLQWIDDNELGINMRDDSVNVVWRCIGRNQPNRVWNLGVNFVTGREDHDQRSNLRPLYECRPYELGWLLYAFASWNRA